MYLFFYLFQHIYYNKTGNTPSGRLYDKYQNHTKRLRKLGILTPTQHRSENINPNTNPSTKENLDKYEDNDHVSKHFTDYVQGVSLSVARYHFISGTR